MSVFKRYKGKRITSKHPAYHKAHWWVWKRINGRIIHRSIPEAQNKEQAELAERKLIENAFNRRYGIPQEVGFVEFANGPYTRYFESVNTNIGAKRLYVQRLCAAFKGKTLDDISPQDCRDVQTRLRKTTSDSSVNRIMSTASRLFSLACEEGILDRNPMQYVKMLKEPPPRERLLTAEEKERLWKCLESDPLMHRLVLLAVNLPLRRGQLLALTPSAIDLQNGLLAIIQSKGRDARLIPLNSTALRVLQLMKNAGEIPFPLKDFRKRWQKALTAAKIEGYRFHDLRREFASELIRKNVNPSIVQKLFAHSDMSITNVYMHSDLDELKAAVNTLDATIPQPPQEITGLPN